MIIVEGPDGAGKTTLIQALGREARKFRALRTGPGASNTDGSAAEGIAPGWANPDDPAFVAYMRAVLGARFEEQCNSSRLIAFDRFHLSEWVYGPILRGQAGITRIDLKALREVLNVYRVPVILCLPPWEVTFEMTTREGRERPGYQTDTFLRRAYDGWVSTQDFANVIYNFKETPDPTWVKRIVG